MSKERGLGPTPEEWAKIVARYEAMGSDHFPHRHLRLSQLRLLREGELPCKQVLPTAAITES